MVPENGPPRNREHQSFKKCILGEVTLHRLSFQRVWLLAPQGECGSVENLCWRPDGKLLAITYKESKTLYLVDVENKNIAHKSELASKISPITCMAWLPLCLNTGSSSNTSPTGDYLPALPSLDRSYGQEPERKDFLLQKLDMLFTGQETGEIGMYVFGMFYCGTLEVGQGPVLEINGGSGKPLWASWKDSNGITVNKLSCPLLESSNAFLKIAQAEANVEYLMDYLSRTLMAITEAWETILLEMDEKLTRYAEDNPPGSVAADFLELLMIGIPSENLESFLLRDLTEKGLKKLGHSIEMCYSNIQKLVLKHLNSAGMALAYQVAEMRGMARLGGDYEALGLVEETPITDALHRVQAFLAKTSEVQQVIDHSMRDYKAFFRWLYVVILRLTDERVPPEINKLSQQELTYIAEFLRGFDNTEAGSGRKGVNLEKLGQYLRREPLQNCLKSEGSEWASMLDENFCLRDHPLIIKQDLDCSLLQTYDKVVESVKCLFAKSYQGLTNHFVISKVSLGYATLCFSQIVSSDDNLLVATNDVEQKLLYVFKIEHHDENQSELTFEKATLEFDESQGLSTSRSSSDCRFIDLQFYSADYLSVLIFDEQMESTYLIQFPIKNTKFAHRDSDERLDFNDLVDSWPRPFHGINAKRLTVSGQRKVVAILSENNRKIRLLETEVEPEDEEEEDEEEETGDDSMMDITSSTQVY
ncbi:anaphase-promoting complex subunit 4 isoform X2 [Belonocnema kinseyi]|uniref:anaphase-promoting complex subunit 4 isoform X2 n=1 Tax=Belonocnema kinseyi TaxID=2817044 RepID=UPI00143CEBD9|nr:anaphase-promoting complex subunit 4 isoform X2 [Belonocnema kinseyi]